MRLARTLALPLLAAPLLGACVISAHADHDDYAETVEVIRLEHATAAEVAETLGGLDHGGAAHGGPVAVTVDQRTNAILLRGPRVRVEALRDVVEELDAEM